ncbi:MAG: hypothetical protein OXK77_14940 [Gemmatimonadota bacterium]|nr:hypothetical protein [Gemmatimonadota bacterium]MDE2866606.1 hypothetical protein [Gemmatimonadota bacterium]
MNTNLAEESANALLRLSQRYRATYELPASDSNIVLVRVDLRFEAHSTDDGEPDQRVVDIEAEFLVVYRTTTTSPFPTDALRHFARLNGTYNAWPYWRELVQNMTTRAGMAGITVPVFRPRVREVEVQKSMQVPGESDDSAAPLTADGSTG